MLLAATIVRNAAVRSLAEGDPASAERLWPGHPTTEIAAGMIAIATAAREQASVKPAVLQSIYDASRKDPLAPEPFLVRGVQAQLSGEPALARAAFTEARRRDPRSLPARYFLADDAVRRGDSAAGLREMVALARLAPEGALNMAPHLATYALDRSNWPQLRMIFRLDPSLGSAILGALAKNPANAELILALADEPQRNPQSQWASVLMANLVAAGDYQKAREVWGAVSHVRLSDEALLFDPAFSKSEPPPAFNWWLAASTVGLAERRSGGGLHVIYYGQEDGVLAGQLLILPPGNYRLNALTNGDLSSAQSLQWRLTCANPKGEIAAAPLPVVAARGWTFTVAPACKAQQLELLGASSDMPRQVDVTITRLNLTREQPRG